MSSPYLKQSGVYVIVHAASNKRYVGSASRGFLKRWSTHRSLLNQGRHDNRYLQAAWTKHGEKAFAFAVCEITLPEHAVATEQVMMDYYRATDRRYGYNLAPNAGSCRGTKRGADARAKMKEWQNRPEVKAKTAEKSREYNNKPEVKVEASRRMKEYCSQPGRRSEMSRLAKEARKRPEVKEKHILAMKARHAKPEVKAAYSDRMRARQTSPEGRAAASRRSKEHSSRPDVIAARSDLMKKRHADPAFKAHMKAKLQEYHARPEVKAARSAAMKAYRARPEVIAVHGMRVAMGKLIARHRRASSMLVILE